MELIEAGNVTFDIDSGMDELAKCHSFMANTRQRQKSRILFKITTHHLPKSVPDTKSPTVEDLFDFAQ